MTDETRGPSHQPPRLMLTSVSFSTHPEAVGNTSLGLSAGAKHANESLFSCREGRRASGETLLPSAETLNVWRVTVSATRGTLEVTRETVATLSRGEKSVSRHTWTVPRHASTLSFPARRPLSEAVCGSSKARSGYWEPPTQSEGDRRHSRKVPGDPSQRNSRTLRLRE